MVEIVLLRLHPGDLEAAGDGAHLGRIERVDFPQRVVEREKEDRNEIERNAETVRRQAGGHPKLRRERIFGPRIELRRPNREAAGGYGRPRPGIVSENLRSISQWVR